DLYAHDILLIPLLPVIHQPREALHTVHVDAVLAMSLRAVLELAGEAVHVPPELVEGPEGRGIEGHEEVADVGPLLVGVDLESGRRAAEDSAEDVDHQGEAVALVASEVLSFAPEGEQPS